MFGLGRKFSKLLSLMIFLGLLFASFFAHLGQSATFIVPKESTAKRPASDLVFKGKSINSDVAFQLQLNGVDLWKLDPVENILLKNKPIALQSERTAELPSVQLSTQTGPIVKFDSFLASTKGLFRASVDVTKESNVIPAVLTVSLSSYSAVVRASLLRFIGYDVHAPVMYPRLTVQFESEEQKNKFLDEMSDRSLTSRKRWIVLDKKVNESEWQVTLQGVVLEPGRVSTQTVHWGLMTRSLQAEKRTFRALLIPFVMVDFSEKVNAVSWDLTKEFSDSLWFDYIPSDAFVDVSIEDIRWITYRISRLKREHFEYAVQQARLPYDIGKLWIEKLISRRNNIVKALDLEQYSGQISVDQNISVNRVTNGQLSSGEGYSQWPLEFYDAPAESPFRFSQLWRYFLIDGISTGGGQILRWGNQNLLSIESIESLSKKHVEQLKKGVQDYLWRFGKIDGFSQNLAVWGGPYGGANINAGRSVVAGTYLGSDSKVQLVDNFTVNVNAGYFLGLDGIRGASLGSRNAVTLSRSYSLAKPVMSMEAALQSDWSNVIMPKYMSGLSEMLQTEFKCSIPEGPWKSDFKLDGETYYQINYDEKREKGKEEAIEYRAKLIAEGLPEDKIILKAYDRDKDCIQDIEKLQTKNLENFLESMALESTFIVTDSIKLGSALQAGLNAGAIHSALASLSLSPSLQKDYEVARVTMIRRTSYGIQVYLIDRGLDDYTGSMGIQFYTQLLNSSYSFQNGKAKTAYYDINVTSLGSKETLQLLRSLRTLFAYNNAEVLTDHFKPFRLDHDVVSWVSKIKIPFFSRDEQDLIHEVEITPQSNLLTSEVIQGEKNTQLSHKRVLGFVKYVARQGGSFVGFFIDLIKGGGGGDPGNNVGGQSHVLSVVAEGELTAGRDLRPVGIVEEIYRGWEINKEDLFNVFNKIENSIAEKRFGKPKQRELFHREIFSQTESLQLYQVTVTLILYPSALNKIRDRFFNQTDEAIIRKLLQFEAGTWDYNQCDREDSFVLVSPRGSHFYVNDKKGKRYSICVPRWVFEYMKLKDTFQKLDIETKLSADATTEKRFKKVQLETLNKLLSLLIRNSKVGMSALTSSLNKDDFFFMAKVSGYRKNDHNGFLQLVGDTVGKFDDKIGNGIFKEMVSLMGVTPYELYAMYFTDGL